MLHHGHFVQFFDTDAHLEGAVSQFFADGLRSGHVCIMVATAAHREQVRANLIARGFPISQLEDASHFITADAQATLATFVIDGVPNRHRYQENVGSIVRKAVATGRPVSIYGEMVGLLVEDGLYDATIQLEELWNDLGREQDFTLFCGYKRSERLCADVASRICCTHSDVVTMD